MDSVETELRDRLSQSTQRVRDVLDSAELRAQPANLRAALRERCSDERPPSINWTTTCAPAFTLATGAT